MRALSLFSGIAGLDIAAHAAGIETVAFCEIEPFACRILAKRFPGVPIINDVREVVADGSLGTIDVVHGGFPCQDLSVAGKQKGLSGERSGLWYEMLRVVSELRPAYVLAENVRGAVNLALPAVVSGLEGEGYEVRASVVPASAFGAPHKRERLFVLGVRCDVADAYAKGLEGRERGGVQECTRQQPAREGGTLWPTPSVCGNHNRKGYSPTLAQRVTGEVRPAHGMLSPAWVECLMNFPLGWTDPDCDEPEPWPGWPALMGESQHPYEPPRTVMGCTNRAKRLKCLGNAVVPAQARPFFEAMESIYSHTSYSGQYRNVPRETLRKGME